jgi:hypothetical protein
MKSIMNELGRRPQPWRARREQTSDKPQMKFFDPIARAAVLEILG